MTKNELSNSRKHVRCMPVNIYRFCDGVKEKRDKWRDHAVSAQRIINRMWQMWLVYHINKGSADKLKTHFEEYGATGKKKEWPAQAVDSDLASQIYYAIRDEFPELTAVTRGLLYNKWAANLRRRKASKGRLPGWVAILFAQESIPSFTKPHPIPFDKRTGEFVKEGKNFFLELKIDRDVETGKTETVRCQLMVHRRKAAVARRIVKSLMEGEYAFKGSALVYDKGKWSVALSYERPPKEHVNLDADKELILWPGRRYPWIIMYRNGKKFDAWTAYGVGDHVIAMRSRVQRERSQRKQHYRWAGSSQKGHGGKRARHPFEKLTSVWKHFVKRYNNEVTRRLVNRALADSVGKIRYIQPKDGRRDSRFLSYAGKDEKSQMTWDYFQVGILLRSKCEEVGIECVVSESVLTVREPDEGEPESDAA